jgi:hypothetical protein
MFSRVTATSGTFVLIAAPRFLFSQVQYNVNKEASEWSCTVLAWNGSHMGHFLRDTRARLHSHAENSSVTTKQRKLLSSSSSLHGLGEFPILAPSIVVSFSIVFLVYLCVVFRMDDTYLPVVECGMFHSLQMCFPFIPVFYYFFRLKGKCPTHFLYLRFLPDLI